uniref:LysR family transcriptional regulator n=1 Tax=Enterocloster clostridioformis TaxID=1531 RepID=UPI002F42E139
MEIRVLSYFLMVAREENITKAAQLLHITQPTLSRQLMQLEEELGARLFNRSNHRIILTEDGMLLKRRAQEMISLAEKTKREFIREENQLTGEISIGCGELGSVSWLSEQIASFHERYPQVRYELYSGNVDNIKDRMERGLLDIGLFQSRRIFQNMSLSICLKKKCGESWSVRIRPWLKRSSPSRGFSRGPSADG